MNREWLEEEAYLDPRELQGSLVSPVLKGLLDCLETQDPRVEVEIRAHLVEMERMELMETPGHLGILVTGGSLERMVYPVHQDPWAKKDLLGARDLPVFLVTRDHLENKATLDCLVQKGQEEGQDQQDHKAR